MNHTNESAPGVATEGASQTDVHANVHVHCSTNPADLLKAALSYAERGWAVFPCKPRSKAPATEHGFKDAVTDAAAVRKAWGPGTRANIGIAAGASGLIVIDLDRKGDRDGVADMDALNPAWRDEWATLAARTPTGGEHHFYQAPEGVTIRNGTGIGASGGIDVRADGGYVVAAPSVVAYTNGNAGAYEWQPGPTEPQPLPAALRDLLTGSPELPQAPKDKCETVSHLSAPGGRKAEQWPKLDDLVEDALKEADEGKRRKRAFHLGCQCRDNGFTLAQALGAAAGYARRCPAGSDPFTVQEAEACIREAYQTPARDGWTDQAPPPRSNGSEPPPDVDPVTGEVIASEPRPPAWPLLSLSELRSRPRPPALIGAPGAILVPAGITMIYGAPKCGKSFVAIDWACSVATGTDWQDYPAGAGPVVYVYGEGGYDLADRIDAWAEYHEPPAGALDRNLYLIDAAASPLRLWNRERSLMEPHLFAEHILASLPERPRMVFLDPLIRFEHGANENDSGDMTLVMDAAALIQRAIDGGLVLVHHATKPNQNQNGTTYRGSTALHGAVDALYEVTKQGKAVIIRGDSAKAFEPPKEISLMMVPCGESYALGTGARGGPERLGVGKLELLGYIETDNETGMTVTEAMAAARAKSIQVLPDTARIYMRDLRIGGYITSTDGGPAGKGARYRVTDKGREALNPGGTAGDPLADDEPDYTDPRGGE